jgi:hypothetical protein
LKTILAIFAGLFILSRLNGSSGLAAALVAGSSATPAGSGEIPYAGASGVITGGPGSTAQMIDCSQDTTGLCMTPEYIAVANLGTGPAAPTPSAPGGGTSPGGTSFTLSRQAPAFSGSRFRGRSGGPIIAGRGTIA